MPPVGTEIIDLTQDSPISKKHHIIELDSDGEVITDDLKPPTSSGKANGRKGRKLRKKKTRDLEEGEVTQTSVDVSREQSPDREKTNGESGSKRGASRNAGTQVAQVKSLSDRLSSPAARVPGAETRRGRDEEAPAEKKRRVRIRRDRYAHLKDDTLRRSRSPDRLRNPRNPPPTGQQSRTRQDGGSDRRYSDRSPELPVRDPRASRPAEPDNLFFEDVVRTEVPITVNIRERPQPSPQPVEASDKPAVDLLLPAHVSVLDQDPSGNPQQPAPLPASDSEDGDYIEYLDYDDDRRAPGMVRYFETAEEEDTTAKPKTVVCKKCGAEGEHRTYECPVIICLTCGARDEHSTRGCPISKTCFNCGMKGHVSKACPKPYSRAGPSHYDECDRCGSRRHNTNECPTLWRLYDYVDDAERQVILQVREKKRLLALGQGGEGYIATDEWCYNCGDSGHLGDDCRDVPHVPDFPREPSAFSLYNTLAGPFADPDVRPSAKSSTKRPPRDWEVVNAFADGYGAQLPMDVGKQGRRKERARMEQRSREHADQQDEDDWFGRQAKGRGARNSGARDPRNGGGDKKTSFKFSDNRRDYDDARRRSGRERDRDRRPYDDYLPGPSRETDSIQIRGAAQLEGRGDGRYASIRAKDRDRKSSRRREDLGPRYKGSYAR